MGGGNGAKSKQARERNAAKAGNTAKSQLKTNEAAKTLQCKVCFSTFMSNMSAKQLTEHATNRHSSALEACFPGYQA